MWITAAVVATTWANPSQAESRDTHGTQAGSSTLTEELLIILNHSERKYVSVSKGADPGTLQVSVEGPNFQELGRT